MKEYKVPIQSLIDHIKTAQDVDPWAKEMAEELLKEQENEEERILKIVWDVLHGCVSTDTVEDQDWVYEQIRNRVHPMY